MKRGATAGPASEPSEVPDVALKKPRVDSINGTGHLQDGQDEGAAGRHLGRIRYYNGRKQIGILDADDGRELFIPVGGAYNRNLVPLTPGGLMHGTRVSYQLVRLNDEGLMACTDVLPCAESTESVGGQRQQPGLECGVETTIGGRKENQDRVCAADLADIGFLAGVFDGHGGSHCAQYVSQNLPGMIHNVFTAQLQKVPGGPQCLTPDEEEDLLVKALKQGFEQTDQTFCRDAKQIRLMTDGSTAVVALLAHGFQAPMTAATVPGVGGGVAKLFVAWCGDSRAVLVRGNRAVRLSQDHKPDRKDETSRIEEAGGAVMKDANGCSRVGSRRGVSQVWLATSRAFGDVYLKEPDLLVTAAPEVLVRTLTPEDWAVVLCCDGVTDVMTNQDIANVCWDVMVTKKLGPVEAAQEVVATATRKGSPDNSTAFVMRLGWAVPE